MTIIKIKKINNGFLLEINDYGEKETIAITKVCEENDEEKFKTRDEDKICLAKLLYEVASALGDTYDKYGEENLNIFWNKRGHKLE